MRVIYPADVRKAEGYPRGKKYSRKRRLNRKKFMIFILVLFALAAGCIFAWGARNGAGPAAQAFKTVENWFQTPAGTGQLIPKATGAPAASASGIKPSAKPSVKPSTEATAKPSLPPPASNAALPAFLKSGPGDMKAFSIAGINCAKDKVVALTFDDGPNPSTTDEILDALKKYGGNATFFVLGERAKQFPQTIKNIYESGNEIGNHTYDHAELTKLTAEKIKSEVEKTNDILESVLGARPILVRPPYGSITQDIAEDIGKACVLWTVDPEDWKHRNVETDYNNVMDAVKDGDIVLMHDIYSESADAAKEIIRDLTKKGYKLVTVSQMIQIAEARGKDVGLIVSDLRVKKSEGADR